jgi:2-polyprenyl-3-methyl-5-hydroxy-6-metoxy-1,4-benzoquinol methylase
MVEEYYNRGGEPERLFRDRTNYIEYATTLKYLTEYLKGSVTVLDCCAGGGVYAFPLAELGYKVTAGDLMQLHIDIINNSEKRNLLTDVYKGDVRDMSRFADETFDAVLCLGALYHLFTEVDREQCVRECLRVLKNGGVFMFAYINRNAVFINRFKCDVLKDGVNGEFYKMDFGEPDTLMSKFDVTKLTDVGIDGLRYPLADKINSADDDTFDAYMQYHFATCEEPSIIGHSMHGLWIGRKGTR